VEVPEEALLPWLSRPGHGIGVGGILLVNLGTMMLPRPRLSAGARLASRGEAYASLAWKRT